MIEIKKLQSLGVVEKTGATCIYFYQITQYELMLDICHIFSVLPRAGTDKILKGDKLYYFKLYLPVYAYTVYGTGILGIRIF